MPKIALITTAVANSHCEGLVFCLHLQREYDMGYNFNRLVTYASILNCVIY